jgi:hypothetical protein
LQAATLGAKFTYYQQQCAKDDAEFLTFNCDSSDKFAAGCLMFTTAGNLLTPFFTQANTNTLTIQAVRSSANMVGPGTSVHFICKTAGEWEITYVKKLGVFTTTSIGGTCAFS